MAFVRSLALQLADKKIRVNAVAPVPISTHMIATSTQKECIREFGIGHP